MIERSLLVDSNGKLLTQSLFLEIGYTDFAIFTLKDLDYEYNGKTYISLKARYLEMEDPTEYAFANKWLYAWKHWVRLCENKQIAKHIDEWRAELEYKLRSQAVDMMLKSAKSGNYQAAKWLADRGWSNKGAGKPSKADIEHEKKVQAQLSEEYSADVVRLFQEAR